MSVCVCVTGRAARVFLLLFLPLHFFFLCCNVEDGRLDLLVFRWSLPSILRRPDTEHKAERNREGSPPPRRTSHFRFAPHPLAPPALQREHASQARIFSSVSSLDELAKSTVHAQGEGGEAQGKKDEKTKRAGRVSARDIRFLPHACAQMSACTLPFENLVMHKFPSLQRGPTRSPEKKEKGHFQTTGAIKERNARDTPTPNVSPRQALSAALGLRRRRQSCPTFCSACAPLEKQKMRVERGRGTQAEAQGHFRSVERKEGTEGTHTQGAATSISFHAVSSRQGCFL